MEAWYESGLGCPELRCLLRNVCDISNENIMFVMSEIT